MNQQRRRPAPRSSVRVDVPRLVALDVLNAVEDDDSYANLVLPKLIADAGLDTRDAAFATQLAYGTLRMQGQLDYVIAQCVDRPVVDIDAKVRRLLRLGAYQFMHMRVPVHAAVNSTVDLARVTTSAGPTSFINAVLRRMTAVDPQQWLNDLPAEDSVPDRSIRFSHPEWMVRALHESLMRDRGRDWSETEELLNANNANPPVTLVARPGSSELTELLDFGPPGRWSPLAVRVSGAPSAIPAVSQRRAGIQDEGSQLVALALASVPIDGSDHSWVDGCAGPGGKAALLASLAAQRGGVLTAVEISTHRADLVRSVVGAPHRVIEGDARELSQLVDAADRILIDAPCTGLGAIRRRPESRWRRAITDVAALAPLQRNLLMAAVHAVRIGGVVGYATCSPHLGETEFVVDDVIKQAKRAGIELERVNAVQALAAVEDLVDREDLLASLGQGPDLRLWPHRHDTDGMYLAIVRRLS